MNISVIPTITYKGDGETSKWEFPFDYLKKAFVYVTIDGEEYRNFTVEGKTVTLGYAPASDAEITIYRSTDSERLTSWSDGSVLKATDMTVLQTQMLHILEEMYVLNRYWTIEQGRIFLEDLTVGEMINVDTILRGLKTPFYAIGDWEQVENGFSLRIPQSSTMCIGVYKVTDAGDELVMTGVNITPEAVTITAEAPFDGYLMQASLTSWFGGDVKTLNETITQMLETMANNARKLEENRSQMDILNGKVNRFAKEMVKTVNDVLPDENGNVVVEFPEPPDLSGLATKEELEDAIKTIPEPDLSGLASKAELREAIAAIVDGEEVAF